MGEEKGGGRERAEAVKEEKVERGREGWKRGWKGRKATNARGGKEEAGKRNGQEREGVGGDRCM